MSDMLYRISVSILKHDEDARDAVQQALMKAWAARERVAEDYFRPWLVRIVVNECRTLFRKRKRFAAWLGAQTIPAPSEALDVELRDALDRLPEKLRIPLLLHYLEGLSLKETAKALRLPVSTVKGRLFRARKALQAQLTEKEARAHES